METINLTIIIYKPVVISYILKQNVKEIGTWQCDVVDIKHKPQVPCAVYGTYLS